MSTSIALTTADISRNTTIYLSSIIFCAGIMGNFLNIVVFLSLRTFRGNSCAFYLIVMSFVNIGNLLTGLLSRILISGFALDWTLISSFYCKFRWYGLQFCVLTSFTCTCLAIIDQYMATNARLRWRNWSNIETARRITIVFILIWLVHGILYIIYFDLIRSSPTSNISCNAENHIYRQYHVYGYLVTLAGILPLITTTFFGLLAHNNVQQLAYRTVPLVRRHLDKQLTTMVLYQLLFNFIFTLPYTIMTAFSSLLTNIKDPVDAAVVDFVNVLVILLYYLSFSCPFYIYVCACQRFCQQLKYVLFDVHLKRWQRSNTNQVLPNLSRQI